MDKEAVQSLVRAVLKIASGILLAKGYADATGAAAMQGLTEAIAALVVGLPAIIHGMKAKAPVVTDTTKDSPK